MRNENTDREKIQLNRRQIFMCVIFQICIIMGGFPREREGEGDLITGRKVWW